MPKDDHHGVINNQRENYSFAFTRILDSGTTQDQVFETVAQPVVEGGTAREQAAGLEAAAEREAGLDSAAEREAALDSARVAAAPLGWRVKSAGRGARHAYAQQGWTVPPLKT